MEPGGPERIHIGQLLYAPYERFLVMLHEELAAAGYPDITAAHGNHVLRHIQRDGSRTTELAVRARLTKQSIGYLVDQLEAGGYVERVPDPTDGRSKVVRLTARGWELTVTAEAIIDRIEAGWRRQLGAAQWALLRKMLAELEPIG